MADSQSPAVGSIEWTDLTVANADQVRDFYRAVVGWEPSGLNMGGYEDYFMKAPATGQSVAGVCHARGVNADLPPVWLIYVVVEDLDTSMARCAAHGGSVIAGPKPWADQRRYCVIKDPAGAVAAIVEAAARGPASA